MIANHDVYQLLIDAKSQNKKLLAVLLDPDKIEENDINHLIKKLKLAPIHLILIGGSSGIMSNTSQLVSHLKKYLKYPILLFPGHPSHLVANVDALLFNVLLSGNNPDYLINFHKQAVPFLKSNHLEVISNGYILIDGGTETAVQKVTNTLPLLHTDEDSIINTALVAKYFGFKTVYLETGSGAKYHVPLSIISKLKDCLNLPLIVGGGIKSKQQIESIFNAGADIVVIGTAFENNPNFFDD